MTRQELGWLAGIIDGEGSIGVYERIDRRKRISYLPVVTVTNTNKDIIDEVARLTRVGHVRQRTVFSLKWKRPYIWEVTSAAVSHLPAGICKALKAKGEQCSLAWEAAALSTRGRRNPHCKRLAAIRKRIAVLNKRGR